MEVFFYGLFMEVALLEEKGLSPTHVRAGYLPDYTLKIGNRASLIPATGYQAYGLVVRVDAQAVKNLYTDPSVADYIAESVTITTTNGQQVVAQCYNLPEKALTGTNTTYAQSLLALARSLGFPDRYLEHIAGMTH